MFFLFRRPRPRRRRRHRPKRRSRRPSGSSSARASWCGPTTGRASSRSSAPRSSPPAPGSASASTRPPVHADDYFLNRFFCFAHRGMFSLNGFVMAPRLFFLGGGFRETRRLGAGRALLHVQAQARHLRAGGQVDPGQARPGAAQLEELGRRRTDRRLHLGRHEAQSEQNGRHER